MKYVLASLVAVGLIGGACMATVQEDQAVNTNQKQQHSTSIPEKKNPCHCLSKSICFGC